MEFLELARSHGHEALRTGSHKNVLLLVAKTHWILGDTNRRLSNLDTAATVLEQGVELRRKLPEGVEGSHGGVSLVSLCISLASVF